MARRRRRARLEEHDNHERWLVSYADFITLL
ncbi:MAG: Membrane MotB of proton-channel complex MotA/MotB, partial [Pseudomonadota bacterium]